MFKQIKILIILILAVLLIGFLAYLKGINSSADKNGGEKVFTISRGEGVNEISDKLYKAGLIKTKFFFETYVWQKKIEGRLQAGEYVLNSEMNIKEITDILAGGKSLSKETSITIIEGWRASEIDAYLKEKGLIKGDENYELRGEEIKNYEFLNELPRGATLEGFLFPDTYRIFKDAGAEDIVKKMLDNFDEKLTGEMREGIKRQGRSIYEIIIMASMIEKEVRSPDDMKIVSGIFWDRIKNGQALQSDASLSYFLNDKIAAHGSEDLETDTPYNTYKYRGLPPTPICNPGLNAIKAAIYPKYTDYNYFLNRPDTGETIFSISYSEHLKNKEKYLK
jgi:UPF0755 protein